MVNGEYLNMNRCLICENEVKKESRKFCSNSCCRKYWWANSNSDKIEEWKKSVSIGVSNYYKEHPEKKKQISNSVFKFYQDHPERKGKSETMKKNLSKAIMGHIVSDKTREIIRKCAYKQWEDPEMAKKVFGTRGKSWEEENLFSLLQIYFPNYWEYTGTGKYKIGRKVPDFMNIEHKKIIELYGDYYHKEDIPQDRINYFKQFGYDCLIFWASEIKKDQKNVLDKIGAFINEIN